MAKKRKKRSSAKKLPASRKYEILKPGKGGDKKSYHRKKETAMKIVGKSLRTGKTVMITQNKTN